MTAAAPPLAVERIGCRFGAAWALRDVTLAVSAGEIVAVLGHNGAGKSTLIKILAGVYRPGEGTVRLGSAEFPHGPSAEAAHTHGLAFVHQDLGLVGSLSVAENVALTTRFPTRLGIISWRRQQALTAELLRRWRIDVDPAAPVDALEPAERTLVAIARALAGEPRVIVLDEPTAALHAREARRLFDAVQSLRAGGVAVVYVTHRLDELWGLADRVAVLRNGRLVAVRRAEETTAAELAGLIAGTAEAAPAARDGVACADTALRLDGVADARVRDVSLTVARGEILALAGLLGAGQEIVGRIVAGVRRAASGTMALQGARYAPRSPRDAQRKGVAYVPSDRLGEGAFAQFDGTTNLYARAHLRGAVLRPRRERRAASALYQSWGVLRSAPELPYGTLSGGNQQKVLLAKWMSPVPTVLVAEEPTAGLDVGAKAAIHRRMRAAAAAGSAVVVVSSDAEEVAAIADRVVVFCDGEVAGELQGQGVTASAVAAGSAEGTSRR